MNNYIQILNEGFNKRYLREGYITYNGDSTIYVIDGRKFSFEEINSEIRKLELKDNYNQKFLEETPPLYTSQEEVEEDIRNGDIWYIKSQTFIKSSPVDAKGNAPYNI